ncbi:thiamine pyrophosphate-binding protein [Pedobacter sp. HMF7647]|uniref:Thiamine pyrophosphate-binding protein n=1 Tax=Hufsiella arboris TaxID=2695275 RepID=A0A7K1YAU5_9SPHI|nr:thiamine pyrophosphate-binding protein [Hufsiella arboris]MXV51702.1 thiamine pyrophosphate-binding protein [Hufsiella arboris]
MKVSDYIAMFLKEKGIQYVFELSGGMITHLLDSLSQKTEIKVITMHHEQAAAFAADAYGRVTGIPGIALATSGPGATNLLTGIGSCYFDSTPAIFFTGQVNRHEQKGERPIRQLGFQETDIISMAKPITKACFKVENEEDIPEILGKAFYIATEGRPGPVLIDIPMDIQRASIGSKFINHANVENVGIDSENFQNICSAIRNSKRPLILAGRGIRSSFAVNQFEDFLSVTQIPVVTTLLGLDVVAYNDPLRVGFIGSYGNRWANIALGECDLLIVIGSRLDIRQTGADTRFFENRPIFHIDCEPAEINNRIKGCFPVVCDAKQFLNGFNSFTSGLNITFQKCKDWLSYINRLRNQWPDTSELKPKGINPNKFIHQLSQRSKEASCFVADVGSHQMWAAQSIEIQKHQLFLTSGGMGAMGYALPAGIGACFALGIESVVVIAGDGCMQINIQELQTISRNKLPLKIIVMNNQNLGMIRQFQDSYFESRYQSTYWGYTAPDFEKVSEAYGITAKSISSEDEIESSLTWLWNDPNQAALLQVMIDPYTNTYPKIAFGRPITEMEPMSKPLEMEGT